MMNADTWNMLELLFSKHPILKSEPVSVREIQDASEAIGVSFPADYVAFIGKYGGAVVGPLSIIGLRQALPMGIEESSVVKATRRFRFDGWPGVERLAVISVDQSGNPYGIDSEGGVWLSDHDCNEVIKIADTFETFLRNQCLNVGK